MSLSKPYSINPFACSWSELDTALASISTRGNPNEKASADVQSQRCREMHILVNARLEELDERPKTVDSVEQRRTLAKLRSALQSRMQKNNPRDIGATQQADLESLEDLIRQYDSVKDSSVRCIDTFFLRGKEASPSMPFHWPVDLVPLENMEVPPFWRRRSPDDEVTIRNRSLFHGSGAFLLATRLFAVPRPDAMHSGQQDENRWAAIKTVVADWLNGSLTLPPLSSPEGMKCHKGLMDLTSAHDALMEASAHAASLKDREQEYLACLRAAMTYVTLFTEHLKVPLDVPTQYYSHPVRVTARFSYEDTAGALLDLYKYGAVIESPTEVDPDLATRRSAASDETGRPKKDTVEWESYSTDRLAPDTCYIRIPAQLPISLQTRD